ncbi:DEAD/DEAH box helicase family protein [bacterium]|nr:DEAD/DEAH box helicase family protein [bacterium]
MVIALNAVEDAYRLGKWFYLAVEKGSADSIEQFQAIPEPEEDELQSVREANRELKEKLERREEELSGILSQIKGVKKSKVSSVRTSKDPVALTDSQTEQLQLIAESHREVANSLDFNEEQTRARLIDQMLRAAGWDVGQNGKSTSQVRQEEEIELSGGRQGFADYVLYDNKENPVAVVEAKRTSKDPDDGQHQAKDYADGLESRDEVRPIIFYTNGYDIWIWNDQNNDPPRKLYGFYSPASLERLHWQNKNRSKNLVHFGEPDPNIVDRDYQTTAIKQVCARFDDDRKRKALLVLATGTGKTRIAVALADLLKKANWVKRVLFLCDRRELRKQAKEAFEKFMPAAPCIYVTGKTHKQKDKIVYLATYPAMMKCFENFDPGYFDLVIADESHRSIFNRYLDLFKYFDAFQLGLTATPVDFVERNTYRVFDCDPGNPTSEYSYEEAIKVGEEYLVPFRVIKHTTKFLREGIKFNEMTPEQQELLNEQVEDPELIDYSKEQVDKRVFNIDTDKKIMRNLMENGIRNADGSQIGKSIVFARNHRHALLLKKIFDEEYPQYGGKFCTVIDNYMERTEQLIDDFKDPLNELTIAVSVDMLDTGIDVPEAVNLVFAKPLKSKVKFWQMIGRGTRLCPNLFGKGKDKTHFQIFDHWGNFEYFDMLKKEEEPGKLKGLMQLLFEARIKLAKEALTKQNQEAFHLATDLIEKDVNALPDKTISVRDKIRELNTVRKAGVIRGFDPETQEILIQDIAPLMQWRNLDGREAAYKFDELITKSMLATVAGSNELEDLRGDIVQWVSRLPINLAQVSDKIETINKVKSNAFWAEPTIAGLEEARTELRGIMHLAKRDPNPPEVERIIDIPDSGTIRQTHKVQIRGIEMAAYRQQLKDLFQGLFETNAALQKIKSGEPVTSEEIKELAEQAMQIDPAFSLEELVSLYDKTDKIELAIRSIVGMDHEKVEEHFKEFSLAQQNLTANQKRFLTLLKRHIAQYGVIQIQQLYDSPFTSLHHDGLSGVFPNDDQADQLVDIVKQINFEKV